MPTVQASNSILDTLDEESSAFLKVVSLGNESVTLSCIHHGTNLSWKEIYYFLNRFSEKDYISVFNDQVSISENLEELVAQDIATPAEKIILSRAIAQGYIGEGSNSYRISEYIILGKWFTKASLEWFLKVADKFYLDRPDLAVHLISGFLEKMILTDSEQILLKKLLSQSLFQLGKTEEIYKLLSEVTHNKFSTSLEFNIRLNLSNSLFLENEVSKAISIFKEETLETEIKADEENTMLALKGFHNILAGKKDTGRKIAYESLEKGTLLNNKLGMSIASSALAHAEYYSCNIDVAVQKAEKAVQYADWTDSHEAKRRSRYELGMFNIHANNSSEAERIFNSEIEISKSEASVKWYHPLPLIGLGLLQYQRGDWKESIENFKTSLKQGDEVSTKWENSFVRAHLANMELKKGNTDQAIRLIEMAESKISDTPHHSYDSVLWAKSQVAHSLGRPEEALSLLVEAVELIQKFDVVVRLHWIIPDLIRTARKLKVLDDVKIYQKALLNIAQTSNSLQIQASSLLSTSIMEKDANLGEKSVSLLRNSHRKTDLANALQDVGLLFYEQKDDKNAIKYFTESLQLFASFGDITSSAKIRADLRTLGVQINVAASKKETHSNPKILSPAETRVVKLVAQGLSNSEIATMLHISTRTVETHLSRCYSKLGIASRVSLALLAPSIVH